MQYRPPTAFELEGFRQFLLRSARETFGAEAHDGRVIDEYTFDYSEYPRYGRLKDIHGHTLMLGDRFFRLAEMSNVFVAATHLGHDRYGIVGEPVTLESVAIYDVDMSQPELDEHFEGLAAVVHTIDPSLVIEVDWLEMLNRGPSVTPARSQPPAHDPGGNPAGTIMVRDIGVAKVALRRVSESLVLQVDGEETPISQTEANVFLNTSEEQLLDWVFGPEVDRSARLGDLVSAGLREDLEYVFMDQTSFRNALQALDDDRLTPTRLFDLSSLAHHLVFADGIAVPGSCSVPVSMSGIVVATDTDEVRLNSAMFSLSNPNGFRSDDHLEVDGLKQVEAAWRTFLSMDVSIDYEFVDRATKSPGSWEFVVGDERSWLPEAVELLLAGTGSSGRGSRDLSEAASIHTMRYIVNERRAQLMGMPYVASALRYPVQAVRMRNALHFRSVVDHLLRPRPPSSSPTDLGTLVHPFRLPDALGVGCSGARDRSEILRRILELRATMTGFREAIHDSRQVGLTNTEIIRTLRAPLTGLEFARSVDNTVALVSSLAATTGVDLGTGLLVTKLAKPLNLAERTTKLVDLIRRPHVRIMQRYTQLAAAAATTDDLFRLWDMKATRQWFTVAAQLSDLSGYESAKLSTF